MDLTNPDVVRDDHLLRPAGITAHLPRPHAVERPQRRPDTALEPLAPPDPDAGGTALRCAISLTFSRCEARTANAAASRSVDHAVADHVVLRYQGLDRLERRTIIRWDREPDRNESGVVVFSMTLQPQQATELEIAVTCEVGEASLENVRYAEVVDRARHSTAQREVGECRVVSSNESLNRWINQSAADLRMMLTDTAYGVYPYAGIPWFSAPFGRDGIITALETLWASPDIARGVLSFLAATQATEHNEAQDAEPGKILHEMRSGEMAGLGEIPFGQYYGSADATPLFVMLAAAYFRERPTASSSISCGRTCSPRSNGCNDSAMPMGTVSSITPGAAKRG